MNKYKEIKTLGKGSFGRAVLVQEISTSKQYVMKIIQIAAMKPEEKQEALQEAQLLEKFDHPHIISYKESFTDARSLYIVMEYANGGDMHEMIKTQKQRGQLFDEELIWNYFLQICMALKHIHDRKTLHRDLKTQNIFIHVESGRKKMKLGDFGVSKVLSSTVECAKTAIGTPYYLSPELCNNQGYNNKSDIWALGCILYEICTLNHTFEASNMKMLIVKILEGKYAPISSKYSNDLKNVITMMLQKDPRQRPAINALLRMPFIQQKIKQIFPEEMLNDEFNHTIFHGKGDILSGFKETPKPQEKQIEQPPRNVFQKANIDVPPAVEVDKRVPSTDTLAKQMDELDNYLASPKYKEPVRSAYPSNVQPKIVEEKVLGFQNYPKPNYANYPSNQPSSNQPTPSYPSNQPTPANVGMFNYNPPQIAYPSNVPKQENQHQREVQRQLAPMSDKDKIRMLKEKEQRERKERVMLQNQQHADRVLQQQKERIEKIQQKNVEYERYIAAKKEENELKKQTELEMQNEREQQEREQQKLLEFEKQQKEKEIQERIQAQKLKNAEERNSLKMMIEQKRQQNVRQDVEFVCKPPKEEKWPEYPPTNPSNQKVAKIETDDDEDFGDQPDQVFKDANQKEDTALKLTKILKDQNSQDSLCYRIESLRSYLEKQLGFTTFFEVYQEISEANEREQEDYDQNKIAEKLGGERMGFLNVIVQLILVEDEFNKDQ